MRGCFGRKFDDSAVCKAGAFAEGWRGWTLISNEIQLPGSLTRNRLTGARGSDEEGEARGEESLDLHLGVKLALYAVEGRQVLRVKIGAQ